MSPSLKSSGSRSPASLLEVELSSREEVNVSELDSEVEEPRRRWPNLKSRSDLLCVVLRRLRVMVATAQHERSGKRKTRKWINRQYHEKTVTKRLLVSGL
jgi:hypothetical protein